MVCTLTPRERLEARLERQQAQLETAYDSMEELLADNNIELEFDSNEGRQKSKTRSSTTLQKQIHVLESSIDQICRRLNGQGVIGMKLRRKPGGC